MMRVRQTHKDIHNLYRIDASQYDEEHKLMIRRIYDLYKNIENKKGKKFSDYVDEFEYLTYSGVALEVSAISNPRFPLVESEQKRLVKLYLNDVGLLTNLLHDLNVNAVLQDIKSINLGTVYESAVAHFSIRQIMALTGLSCFQMSARSSRKKVSLIFPSIIVCSCKAGTTRSR